MRNTITFVIAVSMHSNKDTGALPYPLFPCAVHRFHLKTVNLFTIHTILVDHRNVALPVTLPPFAFADTKTRRFLWLPICSLLVSHGGKKSKSNSKMHRATKATGAAARRGRPASMKYDAYDTLTSMDADDADDDDENAGMDLFKVIPPPHNLAERNTFNFEHELDESETIPAPLTDLNLALHTQAMDISVGPPKNQYILHYLAHLTSPSRMLPMPQWTSLVYDDNGNDTTRHRQQQQQHHQQQQQQQQEHQRSSNEKELTRSLKLMNDGLGKTSSRERQAFTNAFQVTTTGMALDEVHRSVSERDEREDYDDDNVDDKENEATRQNQQSRGEPSFKRRKLETGRKDILKSPTKPNTRPSRSSNKHRTKDKKHIASNAASECRSTSTSNSTYSESEVSASIYIIRKKKHASSSRNKKAKHDHRYESKSSRRKLSNQHHHHQYPSGKRHPSFVSPERDSATATTLPIKKSKNGNNSKQPTKSPEHQPSTTTETGRPKTTKITPPRTTKNHKKHQSPAHHSKRDGHPSKILDPKRPQTAGGIHDIPDKAFNALFGVVESSPTERKNNSRPSTVAGSKPSIGEKRKRRAESMKSKTPSTGGGDKSKQQQPGSGGSSAKKIARYVSFVS
jgi:hypothetical protein